MEYGMFVEVCLLFVLEVFGWDGMECYFFEVLLYLENI